jgi:elongation factor G
MQQYGVDNIRNLVLASHSGAGKTSLAESTLFAAGVINRLGKVEDGTTTSDFDPSEIKRKISLNLTLLPYEWKQHKVNMIDSPGYFDFAGEVKAAMRVTESALIVICGASGVEVGTEQVWAYSGEAGLARMIFINKMDRENADFNRTLDAIQAKLSKKCIPIQMPIGAHSTFQGIIDLFTMKSYTGSPAKEGEVPAALAKTAEEMREKMVEAIAEEDDKLIEKYLGGDALSLDELRDSLCRSTRTGRLVPVLAGSGLQSNGVTQLMDAILTYLPSPKERQMILCDGQTQAVGKDTPLAAFVFKTSADPYVGKLTYFRVYGGPLDSNSQVWNANREAVERIGQLYMLRGKNQEPVTQVVTGDIGAVAKLAQTATGDTLCSREKPVKLAPIVFPDSIFSESVSPKSKADLDKLGSSLARLAEEDPTLKVRRDIDTGETILSGLGETQLDVAAEKMIRKFGVAVDLSVPKVPYKETITTSAKAEHKHKKQTGGHGQYGHVLLEVQPLPRGSGFEFADKVVGGTIPRNFIPAVEKGVNESVHEGPLGGFPVVDVRATVYDGSYHPVDSSEICFKIAGDQAFKKGLLAGQPVLLEPIVTITVKVPEVYTGDIISDLNTKRARVQGMNPGGGYNLIEAQVPLAEVVRYSIDLKSITQGRGTYTMKFNHYEEVPTHITQKIVAEKQAALAAKEKEKA